MTDEQIVHDVQARVGTVILNYDSPQDTMEAVATVLGSTYLDQHLVVVDNCPDGEARAELRRQLPSTASYLTDGANLGYAAGNNMAVRYLLDAGVEHVVLLNPDARVAKGTIDGLVRAADRVPDAGIVGPRLLHGGSSPVTVQSDGGRVDWERGGATTHVNGGARLDGLAGGTGHVDYVTGACVLLRGRMLKDVGLIPEEYFLYYEETEFALRAAAAGWACIVDHDVRATHFRASTGPVPSRAYIYYMTRNRAVFAQRHGDGGDAVERAYDDLDQTFLVPWGRRIDERVPALSTTFRDLVGVAKQHGIERRTGRYEGLEQHAVQGVKGWEA